VPLSPVINTVEGERAMVASMLRNDCAQVLPPMKCECVVMNREPKLNCEACIFERKSTKVFDY
jgi:hypothetical protein